MAMLGPWAVCWQPLAGGGQATEPACPWWLLASGCCCCWPCRNGGNCFQRSAVKSIDLDQSRGHFPLEFPFSFANLSLSWGGRASLRQTGLFVFFCFCFLAFYLLFWTDGAQYVGELKPQTILYHQTVSLPPGKSSTLAGANTESQFKSRWLLRA